MSRRLILAAAGSVAVAGAAFVLAALPAGAATTGPGASPTPSTSPSGCDQAPWVSVVQGAPAGFGPGSIGGDYLWHDAKGFHLRVTHKGTNKVVYSGTITSPTKLHMEPVQLEKGDIAALSADKKTLVFKFFDYGHVDGVDFHTDCAPWLKVGNLKANNNPLGPGRVYLGAHRKHPSKIPFVLHRNP